jgi:hypothetical protein
VGAKSSKSMLEEFPTMLRDWFVSKASATIDFRENMNPERDRDYGLEIIYEAQFVPPDDKSAYLEVWLAANSHVAIGFEKWGRIARRLGVGCWGNPDRFVGGFEPCEVKIDPLFRMFDLIAGGKVGVSIWSFPLVGLVSASAIVSRQVFLNSTLNNDGEVAWIGLSNCNGVDAACGHVHFVPWQ